MFESWKKTFQLPKFLEDTETELRNHALIAEKNLKAMQQYEKNAQNSIATSIGALSSTLHKYTELKKQNILDNLANYEKQFQIATVIENIRKKRKTVEQMQQKLEGLTEEHEKLKANQNEDQDNLVALRTFKKASKYYCSRFQYDIEMENINAKDRYCVVITFSFDRKKSKYPIEFIFNQETDALISFNAGTLITEQQHAKLNRRFQETNNILALFCMLRRAALTKHKNNQ